jgi:hypothetical protein
LGAIYYATRPTLDDAFTELGVVPGSDGIGNGFISGDCDAIYFGTLDRIWKVPHAQ